MVDQLNGFASEVTRVAREVGTEGKLGGQAAGARRRRHVEGPDRQRQLDGVEPDRPGAQHRRRGDRGRERRPVAEDHGRREGRDPRAEEHHQHDGRSAQRASPSEVTRVAREVGTEGKLGGQAEVEGVAGTWKDLTDNVNSMASNLTGQVRNIAEVTTAVANGDLVAEDHGRREGRDPRAEEHHQHDGRSAERVRVRGHARRARGRHRGQARRPGRRCRASPARGRT